jgi:orotidine-5'-phosphate decarboxylase/adenine/guanine phosphoribosyltransferase-like PRPP-binding protein
MKKRVVILPFDGHESGEILLSALEKMLDSPGITSLISHIKLNDGVHNMDMGGPNIVRAIKAVLADRDLPIGIFLDLKIGDVGPTMENTLKKYAKHPPEILTVSALCSAEGILKLRRLLPNTKLAMLSMLTDIKEDECAARFGQMPAVKIYNDLMNIRRIYKMKIQEGDNPEPFDLVVCSPHELLFLGKNLPGSYGFIVPGIRDEWMKKKDEHQQRITGVKQALDMGATYVVMGAQLTKGNPGNDITPEQSCQMTEQEIAKVKLVVIKGDPLATLKACGGYYKSPMAPDNNYLGPLVAYAGTYESESGPKNYVGYEYFNFAKAEAEPLARAYFASEISAIIKAAGIKCDVVVGAPMGGILLAGDVARYLDCRSIFAEKKVIEPARPQDGVKEKSELIIDRHEIRQNDAVVIVEDVCNNFSTTEKLKNLIEGMGGKLAAIVCAFNRSGKHEWEGIPVFTSCFIPTQQFKQDDVQIADLMRLDKIVWKPKAEWSKLESAMEEASKRVLENQK